VIDGNLLECVGVFIAHSTLPGPGAMVGTAQLDTAMRKIYVPANG
jgi:hypothetical protein